MKKERLKVLLENAIVCIGEATGDYCFNANYLKRELGITKEELEELDFHFDEENEGEEEDADEDIEYIIY